MAVKRKKAKNQPTQNASFVDLEENEREMEKLMGEECTCEKGEGWRKERRKGGREERESRRKS